MIKEHGDSLTEPQPSVLLHELLRVNEEVMSSMLVDIPKKKKIRSSNKRDLLKRWSRKENDLLSKILNIN